MYQTWDTVEAFIKIKKPQVIGFVSQFSIHAHRMYFPKDKENFSSRWFIVRGRKGPEDRGSRITGTFNTVAFKKFINLSNKNITFNYEIVGHQVSKTKVNYILLSIGNVLSATS